MGYAHFCRLPALASILSFLFVLASIPGCGPGQDDIPRSSTPERTVDRITTIPYNDTLEVDFSKMERLPTGIYLQDDAVGEGPGATEGDSILVHYTGFFPDGRVFESTHWVETPLGVVLGRGDIISGWEYGLLGMKVGGRRRLVIPPEFGYGRRGAGSGKVPPNAVILFDVEMLEIRDGTL